MVTMEMPLVSIVTPCYNGASYIEQAILNVLEQGFDRLEHIIVDGGSQDGTVEILRRYPHVRWLSEPDTGQANALNKGFRMAQGDIVGWLNGDDTYTPGAIALGAKYLLENTACDVVYGDCNIVDERGTVVHVHRPPVLQGAERLVGSFIHTPAVFWRRRVFDRVGYLDEQLHYCLDNEFWIRMAPAVRRDYLPVALANYRLRTGSKGTTQKAQFGVEMCLIYEKVFASKPFYSEVPDSLKDGILSGHYWATGVELCREGRGEQAKPYLRRAIDHYRVLEYPILVMAALVVDYQTRHPYALHSLLDLTSGLPIRESERKRIMLVLRSEYNRTCFYLAHQKGNRRQARAFGLKTLKEHPGYIRNRGFMSCFSEAVLGKTLTKIVRALI